MVSFNLKDPQYSQNLQQRFNKRQQVSGLIWIEPLLLRSAQMIYYNFYQVHPNFPMLPTGVAINPLNHWGALIFSKTPILLPKERFISRDELEKNW